MSAREEKRNKEEDDEDVEESRKVNIFNLNSKVGRYCSVLQKLLYICYDDYTLLWISYVTFVLVTHLIRIVNY